VVVPPVFIHDGAVISHSVVGPDVSVGEDARVERSVVRDSIIGRGAVVEHSQLEGSILGECAVVSDTPHRLNLGAFSRVKNEG
jgi:glucose-1-phosphate thymidylyltransferase